MQRILTQLLLLFVGIFLGMMLMRSCQQPKTLPEPQIIRDTITEVKIDTQYFAKPVPYKVEVRDTIYLADTIYIGGQTLYQEVKEYKDSAYYARISGINAYIEEIRVYPRTEYKYIHTTEKVYEKPKKWELVAGSDYTFSDGNSALNVGGGLNYIDNLRTYSLRVGKDVVTGVNYIQGGVEMTIVRW